MKLEEILSIAGQPGLYKYIAQSKNGIIVESLTDGKRMPVSTTARVSSLGDIAIFTETEDKPLGEVLQQMYEACKGEANISHKADNNELKKAFKAAVSDYDEDRVHVSDMKKIISWYNTLLAAGMTQFINEEEEEAAAETQDATEGAEAPKKKAPKAKADAGAAKGPKVARNEKAKAQTNAPSKKVSMPRKAN